MATAPIILDVVVDAPIDEVWADLAHIEHHAEWMADAESIEFADERRTGVGAAFICHTKVGPIRLADHMVVTVWEPPTRMTVRHHGLVSGEGEFRLEPADAGRTRLTWTESLTMPWQLGGAIGARAARPVLQRLWRGNLRRFAARFA